MHIKFFILVDNRRRQNDLAKLLNRVHEQNLSDEPWAGIIVVLLPEKLASPLPNLKHTVDMLNLVPRARGEI